jgi:hypothetical protein
MSALTMFVFIVVALVACAEPPRTFVPGDAGDDLPDTTADVRGPCSTDPQCDDHIACTIDHCREGVCTHEPCRDCCPPMQECREGYGCGRARTPCSTDGECSDGIRCTLDRCRDGRFCEHLAQEGLCANGEVCLAAVGCIPRPPDRCTTAADCSSRRCDGIWSCEAELGCQFRGPTLCDDNDPCTTDLCDNTVGCRHTPRDGDRDGHGDRACGGTDCDDSNPARHPGAMEVCGNGVDDDCDGMTDEGCGECVAGTTRPCYTGPAATADVGACRRGTQVCGPDRRWTAGCAGEVVPVRERCGNGVDDDCDGMVDNGCLCPTAGATRPCFSGPASARSVGRCRDGVQVCDPMQGWGTCMGEITPATSEVCDNGVDDDCDGMTDEMCGECVPGVTRACYTGPPATMTVGRCRPGTQVCGPDRRWGTVCAGEVTPAATESCGNMIDDDCDGMVDEMCCVAGVACTTPCGSRGTTVCVGAMASCAPPAEVCNGADDNCNGSCDEGFTCCARSTRDCTALGFVSGTATCRADCSGWDTSGCNTCGNRRRDGTEQCDGADLGGATCASQGFGGGTLACTPGCVFDTTRCTPCGNGRLDAGEACDGSALGGQSCASLGMGFAGGTLRCTPMCTFDTSMCTRPFDPTGTWVVSPGVNHYCAFGVVNISFGNLTFNDTGVGLSVGGGRINCMMTGASARATRMVNVTCTLPGACNETYTLTGMFVGDNTFTGTFTAVFTGSGCFDCRTRSYAVSATR